MIEFALSRLDHLLRINGSIYGPEFNKIRAASGHISFFGEGSAINSNVTSSNRFHNYKVANKIRTNQIRSLYCKLSNAYEMSFSKIKETVSEFANLSIIARAQFKILYQMCIKR